MFSRVAAGKVTLISLDLPAGHFGGGYSPIRIPLYTSFATRDQKIRLVQGDSHSDTSFQRVERELGGNPLDFLFIDGDHTYEGVKRDFELYSPLVRTGGLVALHDICSHPHVPDCQVDRYWAELSSRYETREIIASPTQGWAGIGLVRL